MASYMELRGTTFDTFTIGKRGPILSKISNTGLLVEAVDSTTNISGGNIGAVAGDNTGTGSGGNITLVGGDSTTATGGSISLRAGRGSTNGRINILAAGTNPGDSTELVFLEPSGSGFNSVGFKAPDVISTNVVWTLPNADGANQEALVTDGSGNLSWAPMRFRPYEAYASTVQNLPTAATVVIYDTERFVNADYTLNGTGGIRVNPIGTNLYEVTYSVSTDSTNGSRDSVRCDLYINGVQYVASDSYIYNRNTANGEGTATKTVLVEITSGDIIDVRADRISGTGCRTIANGSNIVIQQK